MRAWSQCLRSALDLSQRPVAVFFRIDADDRDEPALRSLVTLFAEHAVPVDIAVAPWIVELPVADWLDLRVGPLLGLHQLGSAQALQGRGGRVFAANEPRGPRRQRQEIVLGRHRLRQVFGRGLDGIYSPLVDEQVDVLDEALQQAGIVALSSLQAAASRDEGRRLQCLPITLDWAAIRGDAAPDLGALAGAMATQFSAAPRIGVRISLQRLGADDMRALGALLPLLRGHLAVDCLAMRDLVASRRPVAASSCARRPAAVVLRPGQTIPRSLAELQA